MQVTTTQALRPLASREGVEANRPEPTRGSLDAPRSARAAHASTTDVPPPRSGLSGWTPRQHERLGAAQQTLNYLERLNAPLQELRSSWGARVALTADAPADAPAPPALDALDRLRRQRVALSGGSLDAQLRFRDVDAGLRQSFRVKGLEREALVNGAKERLVFALPSQPGGLVAVSIEPEQGLAVNLRRLDQALAPAGVRVRADAAGEPVFSVPQDRWASVHDQLSVRGEGRRFPDGVLHRVRAEPEPDVLTPSLWLALSAQPEGLRQVLQQVMQGLDRVRVAQRQAGEVVASAAAQSVLWQQTQASVGERLQGFVQGFGEQAIEGRFDTVQAATAAVSGISRERVRALLASS